MKDYKTTSAAVVGALSMVVGHFNFILSPDVGMVISGICFLLLGWFAKDKTSATT